MLVLVIPPINRAFVQEEQDIRRLSVHNVTSLQYSSHSYNSVVVVYRIVLSIHRWILPLLVNTCSS